MPPPIVSIFDVGDYEQQIPPRGGLAARRGDYRVATETVYGSAGLLNHPNSLSGLKDLRGRESTKPFTVHLARRDGSVAICRRCSASSASER
jgi:hypothetical protein